MQDTSDLYKEIVSSKEHWFDTALTIGESGRLVDEFGNAILFGGDSILVSGTGPESGMREKDIFVLKTSGDLFRNGIPDVGSAISGYLDAEIVEPFNVPKKARVAPFVRAVSRTASSEWIPQGVYYIDSRSTYQTATQRKMMRIHAYDAMILADATYPDDSAHDYPMLDIDMVNFIADNMKVNPSDNSGVPVDGRTFDIMTRGYKFPLPLGYSMREALGMIAAAYAGSFVISPMGTLRLVTMFDIPPETRHLITEDGSKILIGGYYMRL